MTPLALLAMAGCLAVEPASDRILARDFTPAWPAFASLPGEMEVGPAPAAGAVRNFSQPELRRLAASLHLASDPPEAICFERRMGPLQPAALLAAMQRELPGARIEILDFGRAPAPEGALEFPRVGLHPAPGGGVWNGAVRYGAARRFPIWARVKLASTSKRVIAREPLKAGDALLPGLVVEETRDELPASGLASSVDEVAGKILIRGVAAGEAIRTSWVQAPKLVLRGDTVQVEVKRGGACLKLEARAEASGAAGDTITVLNPASHRVFRARVTGTGLVSVEQGK